MPPKTRRRKALDLESAQNQSEAMSTKKKKSLEKYTKLLKKKKANTKGKAKICVSEKVTQQNECVPNGASRGEHLKDVTNKDTTESKSIVCLTEKSGNRQLFIRGSKPVADKSSNFLHLLAHNAMGMRTKTKLTQVRTV